MTQLRLALYGRDHDKNGLTRPPLPEIDFCSRCNEHAVWWFDGREWLSQCCNGPAIDPDPT